MNPAIASQFDRNRHLFAGIAGVALALAFPNFNVAGLAWVAPGLLIATASGTTGGRAFRIGYLGGLMFHLVTLHWLLHIPVRGFPILGWIALSAFLALYQGAWVWIVCRLSNRHSGLSRQLWALGGAAAWVTLEMVQARFLSGFPWHLLGVSQIRLTPLIQIAAVAGVYGVSFIVVWASLSLVNAMRRLLAQPTARYAWLGEIILPLIAVLGLCVFGLARLRPAEGAANAGLRVAFVQPSIPQTMIWNPAENEQRFAQLMQLTAQSLTHQPELILWPEAAMPGLLRYDEAMATNVLGFARSNQVWMIIGSDDAEPAPPPAKPGEVAYFNASFLINPAGEIAARYCKRNLVIFGEYIPLARWLPFVKWFTPIEGGFTPGERAVTFELNRQSPPRRGNASAEARAVETESPPVRPAAGAPVRFATLICFEDVFPHHVRGYVDAQTDFLVNLTNDGWFGQGAEQWQHAHAAAFRAVENNVPLLRACNNGLTCWIDARGRIQQLFRDPAGSVYGAGVMVADIPLRNDNFANVSTFYHRHGDWFGWGCVALTVAQVLGRCWRRKRPV